MILPCYITNGLFARVQIAGHTTENNVHQMPGSSTPLRCCSISLTSSMKKCSEWILRSKFLFWMKNLSDSTEWRQNLRYTSTSLNNIYSMWGIVKLGDWTEAANWNSNTAVLAQHIYLKAMAISKCDLMHIVLQVVIQNKAAYSSSYQYTVYLTRANSIRSQTSNSCSVTTPSAMSLSEYFFSTCCCRRICLYISGWVNMGSSISLWPNRL